MSDFTIDFPADRPTWSRAQALEHYVRNEFDANPHVEAVGAVDVTILDGDDERAPKPYRGIYPDDYYEVSVEADVEDGLWESVHATFCNAVERWMESDGGYV